MKRIVNYINEQKNKYIIKYITGGSKGELFTNNYKTEKIFNDCDYCEVYDNNYSNFSELDSLVCFKGKNENGFWYSIMKNSENPSNAPKWATILKKNDLEKLKEKYIE